MRLVFYIRKSGIQPFQRDRAAVKDIINLAKARRRGDTRKEISLAFTVQVLRGSFITRHSHFDNSTE